MFVFAGASPVAGQTVVLARADGSWHEARPANERLADEWISVPEPTTFAIPGGGQGHAFFYPPVNPQSAGLPANCRRWW